MGSELRGTCHMRAERKGDSEGVEGELERKAGEARSRREPVNRGRSSDPVADRRLRLGTRTPRWPGGQRRLEPCLRSPYLVFKAEPPPGAVARAGEDE